MKKFLASLIVAVMMLGSFSFVSYVRADNEIVEEEINAPEVNEIIEQIEENVQNVGKALTSEIEALRDNVIAELERIEDEYGIDLGAYRDRIAEAVEKYQTTEDYSDEDLAQDLQDIYNDFMQEIEDEEVKEQVLENIAEAYAAAREYVENQIDEIKASVKEDIEILKETYPELAEIEDLDDLGDLIFTKIGEYEDAILELIEDYQENPEGTIEELTAKIKAKVDELKELSEKYLTLIKNYVVNGEVMVFDTLEGAGQTFDKENAVDLTFRFDIYYLLFRKYGKIYVDDELVSEENYNTKKGSTVVTLDQEYLNTLDKGEHTIKIALGKNKTFGMATANFTVTEKDTISPATGDSIVLYIALFTIATLGIAIILKKQK